MGFRLIRTLLFSSVLAFLCSCGAGSGCIPKFSDLKKKYPHVLYHGPKEPSEVVLRDQPPANWTPIAQIPKHVQGAIVVSEDWSFFQHEGFDEHEIQAALKESVAAGKLKRGASTITQQVVKNIYLTKEKSIVRKARELWLSTKIEKVIGKARILELYLNIAEMGEGIFGIGAAARYYFQKAPADLRPKEAAFLAMLLPSPKRYAISFRKGQLTPYARRIIRSVLNKMVAARYLTAEQRDQEWQTPFSFEKTPDLSIPKVVDGEDAPLPEEEEGTVPEVPDNESLQSD